MRRLRKAQRAFELVPVDGPLFPEPALQHREDRAGVSANSALALSLQWARIAQEALLTMPNPPQHRLYRVQELVEAGEAALTDKKYFPPATMRPQS